ncbi:hypothetical protein [Paenibacillus sp. UNC451MF]|uniref:hypothetical protein n=1 Tax=Paenibacillus sp. UNC451MF TaxID=1449063 RepID=UPI0004900F71|nr:hypothetical protein [Paenibacillus sp. UNC451MF]
MLYYGDQKYSCVLTLAVPLCSANAYSSKLSKLIAKFIPGRERIERMMTAPIHFQFEQEGQTRLALDTLQELRYSADLHGDERGLAGWLFRFGQLRRVPADDSVSGAVCRLGRSV